MVKNQNYQKNRFITKLKRDINNYQKIYKNNKIKLKLKKKKYNVEKHKKI